MRDEQDLAIEPKAEEGAKEEVAKKEREEQQKIMREERELAIEQKVEEEAKEEAAKKDRIQQIKTMYEKRQLAIKQKAEEEAKEDATKMERIRQKMEKLGMPPLRSDNEQAVKTTTPTAMRETPELVVKRNVEEKAKEEAAKKERINQRMEKLGFPPIQWSDNVHAVETSTPTAVNKITVRNAYGGGVDGKLRV
ncbi:MAG: hypothetical protein Q9221_008854 [Calogaya cf. arnoldii]